VPHVGKGKSQPFCSLLLLMTLVSAPAISRSSHDLTQSWELFLWFIFYFRSCDRDFFSVLGFELRTLYLLGRCSITGAPPLAVLLVLPRMLNSCSSRMLRPQEQDMYCVVLGISPIQSTFASGD
jgi:hypothetical protein